MGTCFVTIQINLEELSSDRLFEKVVVKGWVPFSL